VWDGAPASAVPPITSMTSSERASARIMTGILLQHHRWWGKSVVLPTPGALPIATRTVSRRSASGQVSIVLDLLGWVGERSLAWRLMPAHACASR
jgi:hypothetical protein